MHTEQLLNEIKSGEGKTLIVAARRFPRTRQGKPVTLSCLLRWVMSGVTGPDGGRVYLESARLAGRWVTTPSAIGRFVKAQTPCVNDPPHRPVRTWAARRRASERAAKKLAQMGI